MDSSLTLGISPCPNDTFLFDALLHQRIPHDLDFDLKIHDVEELNRLAQAGQLDITKISYHAFFHVAKDYALLRSGSALGHGCGPLLVSNRPELGIADLPELTVAIPGEWTTAHLLLRLMAPKVKRVIPVVFDQVLPAMDSGLADAGLVIHELRFTYAELGYHLLTDLGEWWEKTTGKAIPLGAIIAKRSLGQATLARLEALIRESTEFAFSNPQKALPFMSQHAQDMDPEVMRSHVGLYVNEFTRDLGPQGISAVEELHRQAVTLGAVPKLPHSLFFA